MPKRAFTKTKVKDLPAGLSSAVVKDLLSSIPDIGFKSDYLKSELLSKYCDATTTPRQTRARRAVAKWLASERANSVTNVRLFNAKALDTDFGWALWDDLLSQARRLIRGVLCCDEGNDLLSGVGLFSNGARTDQKRGPTAALRTLTGSIHVSSSAIADWLTTASNTRLSSNPVVVTDESVMFTVPKKSDIDRVACKEPSGNAYLQRLVGVFIRKRLRRVGINLRDQSRNRRLAQLGSSMGNLATIDLSSASDSISSGLVFDLLPFEWWSFLDDIRIKRVRIPAPIHPDGVEVVHDLSMFSSMGNGFTFELESLIFWALARSIMSCSKVTGVVSVYGDDIIVPVTIVPRLVRVFHFCGFRTNSSKTFFKGKFRESCGGHYYAGLDVTPFYIRGEIRKLPHLISLLNQVLEWSGRGWGFFTDPELQQFHRRWARYVPKRVHGGVSPDDPSALVTGDGPRDRLVPDVSEAAKDYSDEAALTFWLMAKQQTPCTKKVHWFNPVFPDLQEESRVLDQYVPVEVNPVVEVGLKYAHAATAGERTTWRPYLALS